MTNQQQKPGCGCLKIPLSVILFILGGGYWWLIAQGNIAQITKLFPDFHFSNSIASLFPHLSTNRVPPSIPTVSATLAPSPIGTTADRQVLATKSPVVSSTQRSPALVTAPRSRPTPWEQKAIRGLYVSRYQITNNTDEQTIRQRVRYYHSQGINTIIHGVWGNGCTMYNSEVMQQILGTKSCLNQFQNRWLDWTIDEAHTQGMQVHAYFEKGIKIDKDSPIFERAIANKWLVPGVDRTYARVEHYVLDVEVPEVANLFKKMLAEFVIKYPQIDAVQWDDYLGYHAELPGKVDRTASLTKFVRQMISEMKAANPAVKFDLCHHNPYWAKRYFAADWERWGVDRVFIQNYNEKNFQAELNYAVNYAGVAITDSQLPRLKELVNNPKIKSILIFPIAGKPAETADRVLKTIQADSIVSPVPKRIAK
ncbi:family 10 glycosylhydrolase [Chamaesiphon sp.]|uniref:family 10 glycosylhydrolase n=1 Tax=Chamaesiphon sp. TaxID=2814140 RepID=UPI003593B12B